MNLKMIKNMNKKFTEGIWYVDTESDGNLWIATGKSTAAIANICCSSSNGKTYEPSDEEKANAQLIVSAPLISKNIHIGG